MSKFHYKKLREELLKRRMNDPLGGTEIKLQKKWSDVIFYTSATNQSSQQRPNTPANTDEPNEGEQGKYQKDKPQRAERMAERMTDE